MDSTSGFQVPPMPPELVQALRMKMNASGMSPANPGAPIGPPVTPATIAQNNVAGMGPQPPAGMPPAPPPPPAPPMQSGMAAQPKSGLPQPTDDPTMVKPVQAPDVSSYITPALKQAQDLMTQRMAIEKENQIDPQKLRPRWWERALGFVAGATQLSDPQNAGKVAGEIVNRRMDTAQRNRDIALQPIDAQIAAQKEMLPLYTAAGEAANNQGRLNLEASGQNETQRANRANEDINSTKNQISQFRANATAENYQTRADQLEKKLQEQHDEFMKKDATTQEKMAMQQQFKEMSDQLYQQRLEFDRQKLSTTTDARGIDQEEQEKLRDIETRYGSGARGMWNTLVGNKQKEIDDVQKMANARRANLGIGTTGAGAPGGAPAHPAAPASAPTPQTHSWSKGAWAASHPGQDPEAAATQAQAQGYEVRP